LQTIREAEQFPIDSTSHYDYLKHFDSLANSKTVEALITLLVNDTYEPNRQAAYQLLVSFDGVLPGLQRKEEVDGVVKLGLNMV
jgi:hypothetical protein